MNQITGIDYLTGANEIPVSELNFISVIGDGGLFPDVADKFPDFAGVFCNKYGMASSSKPPVVLTDESLAIVRSFYEQTDGRIRRVSDNKARRSW